MNDATVHEKLSKQINDMGAAEREKLSKQIIDLGKALSSSAATEVGRIIAEQAKELAAAAEQLSRFTEEHAEALNYYETATPEALLSFLEAVKKRNLITSLGLDEEFNDALNMAIREGKPEILIEALTVGEAVSLYEAATAEQDAPEPENGYYRLPQSQATDAILGTFSAARLGISGLMEWAETITRAGHGKAKASIQQDGEARRVEVTNGNEYSITLELSDIAELIGNSAPAMKMFLFILIKANQQALHGGELNRDVITFSLEEYRKVSGCKSINSAYNQFIAGTSVLLHTVFEGKCNRDKRVYSAAQLISTAHTENGTAIVGLNPWINWDFLTHYYTIIPYYYFSLSRRAGALLMLAFTQARKSIGNEAKIVNEQIHINLNHAIIARVLNLPSAEGNDSPGRTIYGEIEKAITNIESVEAERGGNIQFIPHGELSGRNRRAKTTAAEYYEVVISGKYAEPLIAFGGKKTDKIQKSKKRREKLIDTKIKAIAEAEAKIEAAAKAKTTE